jgi:hypothetical protein
MSKSKSPPADALPDDLTAASILKSRHAFTAILNECVCRELDAATRSWGGNAHIIETLYSEREYIATGLRLCETLPGMGKALQLHQKLQGHRARQQHDLVDAPLARSRKARQGGLK